MNERLDRQMDFLDAVEALKVVERRNRTVDRARRENSAEHSWHVALMALVLAEHAEPGIDRLRVVAMLLVHDLVEIHAGDTWLYDDAAVADQAEREADAAARLFARLPDDQAAHFLALWREFDARETPEARFAAAIDALQPLANHVLSGDPDESPRPARSQVLARKEAIAAFPNLWERAVALVEVSVAHGLYEER